MDDPMREIAATERLLDGRVTAVERTQLSPTTAVLRGPIASTIVDYAGMHGIDLIVMGTEGEGQHGLLGRVVERVVRLGPCPVLTVKEQGADRVETPYAQTASTFV